MAFDDLRQRLQASRHQAETARVVAAMARERFVRLSAKLDATPADVDHTQRDWDRLRTDLARARAGEIDAIKAFGAEADPTVAITELRDSYPILMMPVRLETRFRMDLPIPELQVRIYPDDCSIDSFEPTLSEDEAKSARLYWQGIWAAGKVEEQRRGAWRLLAGSQGPGRAEWIAGAYLPLNRGDEPEKREATDVVLVIPTEAPPDDDRERRGVCDYWTAVWRADGVQSEVAAARATLATDVGGAARADALIAAYAPFNLDAKPAPPLKKADIGVSASFLVFLNDEALALRHHSWSTAARSALLPDRFVFMGYIGGPPPRVEQLGEPVLAPLVVSPDPSAPDTEQLRHGPRGELIFPDDMLWMVDFDRAVASGMGFRIPLNTPDLARGFDRVIVAGVRLSSDQETSRKELESLLVHHRFSRAGLAVLPQGTPTNNADDLASGYSRTEDADASFDDRKRERLWDEVAKFSDKADGQWLAEHLGVDLAAFSTVRHSGRRDQAEARALNAALWPATLGYWMGAMMPSVFDAEAIEWTRGFFTGCVTGRGPVPAIRIGDQPYGILPATPYSRSGWFEVGDLELDRLAKLWFTVKAIADDWRAFVPRLSYVGKSGDPHQILLDVLGLHSGSVEFSRRLSQASDVYRRGHPAAGKAYLENALRLIQRLGYPGTTEPEMTHHLFLGADAPLDGPLIDDRPLSETAPIRAYTADGQDNYLGWLAGAASRSLEELQREEGFKGGKPPRALLYRLLKRALELGYADTGPEGRLHLVEQVAAIQRLKDLPTARLERIFTEHLDCCTHRPDAWMLGVLFRQLVRMRLMSETTPGSLKGIYLGAYAWLENVRPDPRALKAVTIADHEIAADFASPTPLFSDKTNQGYIHAPSLNQAVAAAILRNGYISNAGDRNPDTMAVNLTSERVRTALSILEGLRGGQSLGALLGYRFERGLHDRHTFQLDQFILGLRREFPLASNRLASTRRDDDDMAIEAIEARNVVDGVALVEYVHGIGSANYPFAGKPRLSSGSPDQNAAITAETERLIETYDAIADLAMSEGVFQAVLGNYDRLGATLDSFGKGTFPPEPQVVRTPADGTGITHRVGLHLHAGADPHASPVSGVAPTPRSLAEPAVNVWIAGLLPPLDQIGCLVRYRDGANAPQQRQVTLRDLDLQAVDVLLLVRDAQEASATELDERITALVAGAARPDAPVSIAYLEKTTATFSLFEAMPLIRHLRRLLRASRPLNATDLVRAADATSAQDAAPRVDTARMARTLTALRAVRDALARFVAPIAAWAADPAGHRADVVANCDAWIDSLPALFGQAALFGIPQSGWSFAYEFRRRLFVGVRAKAAAVVARWDGKLADHDALIAKLDALPGTATDAERLALLTQAESTIVTSVTVPLPPTPAAYRTIADAKRAQLAVRRAEFAALRDSARLRVKDLLADFEARLPITPFDLTALSTNEEIGQCVTFTEDVVRVVNVVAAEAGRRIAAAEALLAQHDAAAAEATRCSLLVAAAKALLGEDFLIVPEISLTAGQADEVAAAVAASPSLLAYLTDVVKVELPVDSWLYGMARVRERMRDWEQVVMFAGALGSAEPELTSLQFPVIDDDRWLAMDFPPGLRRDVERLLYTAHLSAPFDRTTRLCGLLLDEWTEVIPSGTTTTGVALHYDRPNNEAPQTMLLLTPALTPGRWQWQDVRDALYQTIDLAKLRAVEPRHIDNTTYAQFLPALVLEELEDVPGIAPDLGREPTA